MHRPTRRQLLQSSASLPLAAWAAGSGGWRLVQESEGASASDGGGPERPPRIREFELMAFGLFLHWGLYSGIGAGEWAMNRHGIGKDEYFKLMSKFTAEGFDGAEIARVAKRAGMRYATLTSRHHDGFSLYDTRGLSSYDVTHTPAGRDLVLDFVEGCRSEGITPMLYCTTLDWTDPRFHEDWDAYQQYLRDSVELLCTKYGPIGGFWFDGNWSRRKADWQLDQLYGLIRRHQPEALIINNTGLESGGKVGHPEIDSVTFERGRAKALDRSGMTKYVAGEMCHTFNFHWGIATQDFNMLSPANVIEELCTARRAGANLLMNVGPDASGRIPDYERAALAKVGDWIEHSGGAEGPIYAGVPTGIAGEERDFGVLVGDDLAYLFVFDITPTADSCHGVKSRGPGPRPFTGLEGEWTSARWMDNDAEIDMTREGESVILKATKYPYGTNTVVRVARLSRG
ncbi:MAG: alpha-L-fucosidase [Planctomycetota bacterium]